VKALGSKGITTHVVSTRAEALKATTGALSVHDAALLFAVILTGCCAVLLIAQSSLPRA
jgi:hypothetical protein